MRSTIAVVVCLALVVPSFAQMQQPLEWLKELTTLENTERSLAQRQAEITRIRHGIEDWIAAHPGSGVDVSTAPDEPWNEEQIRGQIVLLRGAVEHLVQEDPSQPFNLGVMVVNVTASEKPVSPVSDSLDQTEIRNRNALTVDQAIEYLPGVSVDHKAPRNQTGISIGGFDTRQVPLYLDGTPVYVPYDGYVDLTRY